MIDTDIELRKGDKNKPVIIFIHGLGMDKNFWVKTSEVMIAFGLLPLDITCRQEPDVLSCKKKWKFHIKRFTAGIKKNVETSFNDFERENYPLVTWSQSKPFGGIDIAVNEFEKVLQVALGLSESYVILVGHSRGGLIARKYLEKAYNERVKMLITIGTPHHGSNIARWFKFFPKIGRVIGKVCKFTHINSKFLNQFVESQGILELMPTSGLISSLRPIPAPIKHINIVGTDPSFFRIFRYKKRICDVGKIYKPLLVFDFPKTLVKIMPKSFVPDEWVEGRGDGLVSVKSASSSFDSIVVNCNHIKLVTEKVPREVIFKVIKEFIP
jgi:pimeloyl-ACP methyl ester carboxylesterase